MGWEWGGVGRNGRVMPGEGRNDWVMLDGGGGGGGGCLGMTG